MTVRVNINPNIVEWALNKISASKEEIYTLFPKLREEPKLTVKQAQTLAKKLKIPFGYLFLPAPPETSIDIPFFRTLGESSEIDTNVVELIKIFQQRQTWLREYLKDNYYPKLDFVGKYNINTPDQVIIDDIYKTLGLKRGWTLYSTNRSVVISTLIERLEEQNIIVVFNSVVGNNNNLKIPVSACRGFVLIDEYAPFMFVNSADWPAAQLFTIAHEIVHIWLGKSAGFDYDFLMPANDPLETKCDRIAAEFLVPKDIFLEMWKNELDFDKNLSHLSRKFKVSRLVIARRALDLRLITRDEFFAFYRHTKEALRGKENKETGGNFYATQQKRLSRKYLYYIKNAVQSGNLLYREAYLLTGLKGKTFNELLKKI